MEANETLKACLEERCVKISRLSKLVGFDVAKIIYGKRKLTVDELLAICDTAEIDPAIFLHRKEEKHEVAKL